MTALKRLAAENAQAIHEALHSLHGATIRFYPEFEACPVCGERLKVYKITTPRPVVSLQYGSIAAQEVQLRCPNRCAWHHEDHPIQVYRSQALAQLVAPRQMYGFDILARIGTLRYLECRQRREIQEVLEATHDLHIPDGTIQELIVRFADTMAALHEHRIGCLRQMLEASGGYILHVDGTCEEGSQIHFVCLTGPAPVVLWSAKIASENALQIREVLQQVDNRFGRPAATVADLSGSIHKAVLEQWPGLPFFYCHWHLLADVGKDLLTESYACLRERLRQTEIRTKLRRLSKKVDKALGDQKAHARWICRHLETPDLWKTHGRSLKATAIAAGMTEWVLSAPAEGDGRGFPFDLPHLGLYLRARQARDMLETDALDHLKGRTPRGEKLLMRLYGILDGFLKSMALQRTVQEVQEANTLFTRLRDALRLTSQNSEKGLNGTVSFSSPEQALQTEADVHRLHQDLCRERETQVSVMKRNGIDIIVKHLDKYGDGLFGHCLVLGDPDQRSLMVQRTNNISERFFRGVKRFMRRITGKKKLNREVNAMPDQALLIFNLKTPGYVKLICGSLDNLAQAFAELSQKGKLTQHVRKPSSRFLDRKSRRSRDFPDQARALFQSHELGQPSAG
jgi:hypothetical protein